MVKTAPISQGEVVYGTPRTLPTVLLCQADINFCGRHWLANSWPEYDEAVKQRQAHEVFCSARDASAGIISVLGQAEHSGLLVAKR